MARPLRIEFVGALYHVISRGDRQEDIYLDNEDREMLLKDSQCFLVSVDRGGWLGAVPVGRRKSQQDQRYRR